MSGFGKALKADRLNFNKIEEGESKQVAIVKYKDIVAINRLEPIGWEELDDIAPDR